MHESDWGMQKTIVTRVSLFPYSVLEQYRNTSLRYTRQRIIDDDIQTLGESISDSLYNFIPTISDKKLRNIVIQVRRDIHNHKHVKPLIKMRLKDVLPQKANKNDIIQSIERFEVLLSKRDRYVSDMQLERDVELDDLRAKIGVIWKNSADFRSAVAIASPEFAGELLSNSRKSGTFVPDLKEAETLMEYLSRGATKTTPFGLFCGVGLAGPIDDSKLNNLQLDQVRVKVQPSVPAINHIIQAVLDKPENGDRCELCLNPNMQIIDGSIYLHRVTKHGYPGFGANSKQSFTEDDLSLPLSDGYGLILKICNSLQQKKFTYAKILKAITSVTSAKYAESCVEDMIRLQVFIIVNEAIPTASHDVMEEALSLVSNVDVIEPRFANLISQYHRCLVNYPCVDENQRIKYSNSIRNAFTVELDSTSYVDDVSDPFFYINTTIESQSARTDIPVSISEICSYSSTLRGISLISSFLDPHRELSEIMRSYFLIRHRTNHVTDLHRFFREFQAEVFNDYCTYYWRKADLHELLATFSQLASPELEAIYNERHQLHELLNLESPNGEPLYFAGSDLTSILGSTKPTYNWWVVNHYIQLVADHGNIQPVWTRAYGSLGYPYSRFGEPLTSQAIRKDASSYSSNGMNHPVHLCEVDGDTLSTNLNLHESMLPYRIVCPGQRYDFDSSRKEYSLNDIDVIYNASENRLVLQAKDDGIELVPVYQGYYQLDGLPTYSGLLLLFAPPTQLPRNLDLDFIPNIPETAPLIRPRVYVDKILIRRKQFWFSKTQLSRLHFDKCYLEKLHEKYNIPRVNFLFVQYPDVDGKKSRGQSSPRLVDLDNPLLMESVIKSLLGQDYQYACFEEAYPDFSHAQYTNKYAQELVLSMQYSDLKRGNTNG
jgi:hypothetical protein